MILRYGAVIYNARNGNDGKPKLSMQTRLIKDGKVIVEGSPKPVEFNEQADMRRIDLIGAVKLGTDLKPGDYIFQIIVIDELAKESRQTTTQWIDFEVSEQ